MQPFLNGERYLVCLYLLHQYYDQLFPLIREMSSQRKILELFF